MNWKSVKDPMHFSAAKGEQGSFDVARGGGIAPGEPAGGTTAGGGGEAGNQKDAKKEESVGPVTPGPVQPRSGSPFEQALASAGSGMFGATLKPKEMAALTGSVGSSRGAEMASMASGMAAQRDAADMIAPSSGRQTPSVSNSFGDQSGGGGEAKSSNKVESALPSAQIFHDLFGIGAGGKGSTSFGG